MISELNDKIRNDRFRPHPEGFRCLACEVVVLEDTFSPIPGPMGYGFLCFCKNPECGRYGLFTVFAAPPAEKEPE